MKKPIILESFLLIMILIVCSVYLMIKDHPYYYNIILLDNKVDGLIFASLIISLALLFVLGVVLGLTSFLGITLIGVAIFIFLVLISICLFILSPFLCFLPIFFWIVFKMKNRFKAESK